MGSINKIFFRGFITLLPIALTIYIVYSAILILEGLLARALMWVLGIYIPGLGFLLTLFLIFLFGLMLNSFILEKVIYSVEQRLLKVPFLKAIYSPLKDLMNMFSRKDSKGTQSVVLVDLSPGMKMIGIVTREQFADVHLEGQLSNHVAVFLPFSYGMGGYTVLAERSKVQPIDVPIEKAMSLAVTGWVKAENKFEKGTH